MMTDRTDAAKKSKLNETEWDAKRNQNLKKNREWYKSLGFKQVREISGEIFEQNCNMLLLDFAYTRTSARSRLIRQRVQ